jgi:hypothetical protein
MVCFLSGQCNSDFFARKRFHSASAWNNFPDQKGGTPVRFPRFKHSQRFLALPFALVACLQAPAQQPAVLEASHGAPVRLDRVGLVIGMPGLVPNRHGTLNITAKTLRFSTPTASAEIERDMITSVATGDETIELGGTVLSIARMALLKGSGLAVGAMAHKKVGLLSVEFRNSNNEYHGAVFVLRPKDIAAVQRELVNGLATAGTRIDVPAVCPTDQVRKGSVRLAPIQVDEASVLPAEYRVLLYEQLLKQLQREKNPAAVYRDGDPAAECAEFSLTLNIKAFKKGNQVLRASMGPLGAFFGATSLSYHLTAKTPDGTAVIDKDMKSTERKDTDSLNVTKMMSNSIAKDIKKVEKLRQKSQTS